MSVRYLTMEDMKELAHTLTVELFSCYGEPMPPFDHPANQLGKLEAALFSPQQSFGGHDLYPSVEEKAAILFYGIVKAHALHNGNKRIGCTALIVFLDLNGRKFICPADELERNVIALAESSSSEHKVTINRLTQWISAHTEPLA